MQFIRIVGAVALGSILVTPSLMSLYDFEMNRLKAESSQFAYDVVPDIADNWNEAELIKHASPRFLSANSPDFIHSLFSEVAKFGAPTRYAPIRGNVDLSLASVRLVIEADYNAPVTLTYGRGDIFMHLLKLEGGWTIDGFRITAYSPSQIEHPQSGRPHEQPGHAI